jgi:rhodanese-related sulfurtransferase
MDITVQELKEKIEKGEDVNLIDVREPYEYEEFNIGGDLIPLGELQNRLGDLDYDKDDEIILYCKSGQRSGVAKELMKAAGYANARNLLGGVKAWKKEEVS